MTIHIPIAAGAVTVGAVSRSDVIEKNEDETLSNRVGAVTNVEPEKEPLTEFGASRSGTESEEVINLPPCTRAPADDTGCAVGVAASMT